MKRDPERIAALNDRLRTTLVGGQVVITQGVAALGMCAVAEIILKVRTFDNFGIDNNPHGERDFGAFDHLSARIFWKIDYYDTTLKFGSEDPTDPAKTTRVLTILLASEW
jgi:hypothetical protein